MLGCVVGWQQVPVREEVAQIGTAAGQAGLEPGWAGLEPGWAGMEPGQAELVPGEQIRTQSYSNVMHVHVYTCKTLYLHLHGHGRVSQLPLQDLLFLCNELLPLHLPLRCQLMLILLPLGLGVGTYTCQVTVTCGYNESCDYHEILTCMFSSLFCCRDCWYTNCSCFCCRSNASFCSICIRASRACSSACCWI